MPAKPVRARAKRASKVRSETPSELTVEAFEARYAELLSGRPKKRGNESCLECERCEACVGCTFCKQSESLIRCHFCVRCVLCSDSAHCSNSRSLIGCQHCIQSENCSASSYLVRCAGLSN